MRKYLTLVLVLLLFTTASYGQDRITIGTPNNEFNIHNVYGKVISRKDKTSLPGVNIYIESISKGVSTDIDGNFVIKLRKGAYTLSVTFIGYKETKILINVVGDGRLMVRLDEDLTELDEVITLFTLGDLQLKITLTS